MDNNTKVFCALDGDGIGSKVERASLADDTKTLHDVSQHIEIGEELIKKFALSNGGEVISIGGDEANIQIPVSAVEDLATLRSDYSFAVGATLTIGIGQSLSEAGKALMVGKLRGKNQICQYDDSVEQEYGNAKAETNKETPEEHEAKKIGEAYMKDDKKPVEEVKEQATEEVPAEQSSEDDDCPYCTEDNNELGEDEECPYCNEEDEAGSDCPYCDEMHSEEEHEHGDDCPHCQEMDQAADDQANVQEGNARPSSIDQSMNPESVAKAPMEEDSTPEDANAFDGDGGARNLPDAAAPIGDEKPKEAFAEEHKTPEEILNEFDEVHGTEEPSQTDDAKFEQTDDTGIAEGGDRQEENVSRPEDYNEEIPMGDEDPNNTTGSDEPNLGEVMQQDLSNNADNIQKERVGDIVRQALQSFKANKNFLEQAQQTSPEFYQANISMLRAMIEMAKLLGFGGQSGQESGQQPELGQQEQQMVQEQAPAEASPDGVAPWSDPFPIHSDNLPPPNEDQPAGKR